MTSGPSVRAPRREQLLTAAARLMAERGFHGVGINDLGAASGVSGPALYRHFPSKQAVLGAVLVGISERLLDEGRRRVAAAGDPLAALRALVSWHAEFATTEPDLIRVQDRDFASMSSEDQRLVRRLQRRYLELWVEQLRLLEPALAEEAARTGVHAVFGLLNSTPYSGRRLRASEAAELLQRLASAVLNDLLVLPPRPS